MKKLFGVLFLLICMFALVACTKKDDGGNQGNTTPPAEEELDVVVSDDYKGILAGKKIYLTTCGQAEADIISTLFSKLLEDNEELFKKYYEPKAGSTKLEWDDVLTRVDNLEASAVEEGAVVLSTIGGSNKGLGAAGTSVSTETRRANEFAEAAKAGKITFIVFHVGKEARRGDTSDPIIRAAIAGAQLMMVLSGGNNDGLFTKAAQDNNTGLYMFSKTLKMSDSFIKMFTAK